jgi:K+-transporting ATPase A subunit
VGSSTSTWPIPFENPTALTNLLYIWLTLSIPFSLTYTFGKMVKSIRHGAALLGVMVIIFGSWVAFTSYSEHTNNPAVLAAGVHSTVGNTEGKEVRFGDTTSALFNVSMTQTSDGAVDSATDSYNPMGGFGPLTGMMLGEVTPGGTGSGLYTLLIYAIIAVFIGGLMIGRTPEFLGKKIQAKEMKLAGLGRARHAHHRAHSHRHRGVDPRRTSRATQFRAARVHRDPLRAHFAGQQQRVGHGRPHGQHHLLQRHRRPSTC